MKRTFMKHILKIFPIIIFLILPVFASAAIGTDDDKKTKTDAHIMGHVLDSASREHIPFVTIALKGTTLSTMSGESGHYFLKNLPLGEYILIASAMGYTAREIPVKIIKNKTLEINFQLREEALNLDQVVISATKNETNKKTSPAIVNVLSAKQFEINAACSMSETMNFQSGLRMESNCSNCGMPQLRINGLEGKYSQILLDSRPLFSSLATVYGLEQLPVSMIERVEVIRGSGSALFGSNAIGGVVNIITKEPLRNTLSVGNTTHIYQGGGTDTGTSLNGAFVSENNKAGAYIFGMARNRDSYDRNGDGFSDVPELSSETIGFRGYYKTGLFTKVTAEYHRIHEFRRGGDKMDLPPHQADIAEQLEHTIDGGGLEFNAYTRNQKHRFSAYASAQQIRRKSYFGTEQNPDAYGRTKDITALGGVQYILSTEKFLFSPSEIVAGIEYSHNKLTDIILGYNRNIKQYTNIVGAFLQNEWKTEKFNFLIGGRIDKHNKVNSVIFSPRVNLRYSPSETVGLRASYASGYLAPQAYDEDLHVTAVGGKVSLIELDPHLKPEYSHSFSASADLYRTFGKIQANLLVEGFYTTINDVFTLTEQGQDPDGNIIYRRGNASGAVIKGINVEAKAGIPKIAEVQIGYTLQSSRYKEDFAWSEDPAVKPQRKMFRAPDHYGYLTSNFWITQNFTASVFGNYTGRMLVQHAAGYIPADTQTMAPRFWDLGFKIAYDFKITSSISFNLYGGIKNILDQYQKDIDLGVMKDGGYIYGPSMPRMYFVGLRFTL